MSTKKRVTLLQGDITTYPVDAIVNSANKSLLGGSGLDYVIHKKAGLQMKQACIELNKLKGGCPTGQAEVTIAGDLPAQYLIHAVGPRWLDGEHNEAELLCSAYSNALIKANEVRAKKVSFPSISTGVYAFPKQLAGEIAIGTVLSTLPEYSWIDEVVFVIKDADTYKIYQNILSNLHDENLEIKIEKI